MENNFGLGVSRLAGTGKRLLLSRKSAGGLDKGINSLLERK